MLTLTIRRYLALLIVVTATVSAQQSLRDPSTPLSALIRTSWTVENGLPQNTVTGLLQSRDGYVWIATQEGLTRFDGVRFTTFNRESAPGLPSNSITALMQDHVGRIWVGTNAGLATIDGGRAVPFPGELAGQVIRCLVADGDSSILIGTSSGLFVVRSDALDRYRLPINSSEWDVRAVVRHSDGSLWIGTEQQGLFRWDGRSLEHFGSAAGITGMSIDVLLEGSLGDLWIGTSGTGLRLLRRGRFRTVTLDPQSPTLTVQSLLVAPEGGLWAGTTAGLYRIDDAGPEPSARSLSEGDESRRWTVVQLMVDREGSVWLGTFARGLHQYSANYVTSANPFTHLDNDLVYCVLRDSRGRIWVGTDGRGVFVWSPDGRLRQISLRDGLPQTSVFTIFEDSRGTVWLGTTNGGLVEYRERVHRVFTTENGMPNNSIRALTEDTEGYLWIGTRSGLCRMADGLIENFTRSHGLTSLDINTLATDRTGHIWAGTLGGGAVRFEGDRFTSVTTDDGLASNDVRAIYQDADSVLWFGTDRGLVRRERTSVLTLTTAQGLASDVIFSIADDGLAHLWLSSNHGLMRIPRTDLNRLIDGTTGTVRPLVFDRRDGMRSEAFSDGQPAMAIDAEGRFWYPSLSGVVIVQPANLRRNGHPPLVSVEAVVCDGVVHGPGRQVIVPSGTTEVEVRYTGLSFISPNKVEFRYRLEGLQELWVDAGVRRSAYFTTLEPGEYVFHVKARNADGVWNETAASLPIVVESRFYQTQWFRVFGVVALLALVGAVSNLRVRQLERRRALLEQQVRERTAELEHQMALAHDANEFKSRLLDLAAHDLKSPLISIRGFAQLSRHEPPGSPVSREATESILRLAQSMLALINELLDASTIEQGRLQLMRRTVDLSSLAQSVADLHRLSAERKQQHLNIETADPGACHVEVDIGRIQACIENLLTNAFKFSPSGATITLRVEARGAWARVSVQDQGPGLTADDRMKLFGRFQRLSARPTAGEPSTGLGLSIVKQIVELHGGHVSAETPVAGGSLFCIDLPRIQAG